MRFQIIVYLIVCLIGFAGGFYLAVYLQNQIAILVGIAILFAFLTWMGSGAELLGLLREWYKDQKDAERQAKRQPKIEYECLVENAEDHRCRAISQGVGEKGKLLLIRIVNNGLDPAYQCSGRADFEKEIDQKLFETILRDVTLNWSHFDIEQNIQYSITTSPYQDIGDIIQENYSTKRNQDLIPKKAEWLEICLTLKDHNIAYILACDRKSKIQFGKKYRVKLQLVGRELNEKARMYLLDLRSWNDISFKKA